MNLPKLRATVLATMLAATLAAPEAAQANWLTDLFNCRSTSLIPTSSFRSAAVHDPCCNPCQQTQQVCSYVPYTAYRTVCCRVPVTTYQCVSVCDPCSGKRVATYRPVTRYVQQARTVPYTTYRRVCRPVTVQAPVVAPQATQFVPTTGCAAPPTVSCAAPTVSCAAPSVPTIPTVPAPAQQPGLTPPQLSGIQPAPAPTQEQSVARPVVPQVQPPAQNNGASLQIIPKTNYGHGQSAPTVNSHNRTAAHNWGYRPVSRPTAGASNNWNAIPR